MSATSLRFAQGVASGDPYADSLGSFQYLNGTDSVSGEPFWSSETVVSSASYGLSTTAEARPLIPWQPGWRELDLNFGLALDTSGALTLLDPVAYASVPRDGVQLADVRVEGSAGDDRVVVGAGSTVEAGAGSDEFDNTDSQGGNLLVGGVGTDQFLLRAAGDTVIGGDLLANPSSPGLPAVVGLVDGQRDVFLVDSSNPAPEGTLRILDFELGGDALLLDGVAPTDGWSAIRRQLQDLGIAVNAAPQLSSTEITLTLQPGVEVSRDLGSLASDPDGNPLQLVKLEGPAWITTSGTTVKATAPPGVSGEQLAALTLRLAFSDGQAVVPLSARLTLNAPPTALALTNTLSSLAENTSTANRIKVADILISDDDLASNTITLSGADAASFEVIGTGLFLKAGTALDFEVKTAYAVSVSASDPSLPGSTPVSAAFRLAVRDVAETPGSSGVSTVVSITLPSGEIRSIPVSISNADLAPGTNLAVIRDLGINPAGLNTLAEFGVKANGTGLDFKLKVNPGANSSLNAGLDLVAADLLPQLTDPSGRRPDRKLLFYGVTGSGALLPLTYDPITGAGARFYDLDNNGTADFFALSLVDGGFGDKDGVQNGLIDDPSFAGFADLSNLQFTNGSSGTITISDPTTAAPAAVTLRARLTSRPDTSNQIGYVVLTASEVANADSLLRDLSWLRSRAQTLFSTLESSDVTLPSGTSFTRDITVINGQSLRFFEVVDASLNQLTSLSDSRFRLLSPSGPGSREVGISSSSGVRFALSPLPDDPNLNALISQAQGVASVLDLSAFSTAQSLSGTVQLGREANSDSTAGFYRTLDITGLVIAADGVTRLRPGDSGYAAAALRPANVVSQLNGFSVADDQTATRSFSGVSGGSFLAPFAQVNGETFFAFGAANGDGLAHFRSLGNNCFGLEDIPGGGDLDFDDLVIRFDFTAVA
jgi:hypothetical protein